MGTVVCGYSSQTGSAYRWTDAGGVEYLPKPVGVSDTNAYDISADGSTILAVGNSSTSPSLFLWSTADGLVTLNLPSPFSGGREFVNLSDNGKGCHGQYGRRR
jgi:hypothetical protein